MDTDPPEQGVAKTESTKPRTSRTSRLTSTRIAALRSDEGREVVTDELVPGLQLIAGARTKSWSLRLDFRGKRLRLTLGRHPAVSLAQARDLAREALALVERGVDPRRAGLRPGRKVAEPTTGAESTDPRFLVRTVAADFLSRFVEPQRKRPEYARRILDAEVLPVWGARDIRTIKPADVLALLEPIAARAPVMANRVTAIVSQLCRWAVHCGLIEIAPTAQLLFKPGGREKARDRVLSDAELAALWKNLDVVFKRSPRTAAAIRIALLTACRRGELAGARWNDVDLKEGTWRIPPENAKTGVECINALSAATVEVFKALKKGAGRSLWVLPGDVDGAIDSKLLTRSVARHLPALAKLKVKAFTLHDLRRTVRTGLARLQVPPHIAERVLNHAQPGVIAVYDRHAYLAEKRGALERWAGHLSALTAQQ